MLHLQKIYLRRDTISPCHPEFRASHWKGNSEYRQMSDGRFLVGLREATSSEKIIKLKTLLKDDIDISNIMDSNVEHDENIETLLHHVDLSRCPDEMVTLSEDSREVAIYIAGYAAEKLKERFGDCCNGLFTSDSGADFSYVQFLSR